MRQIFAMVRKRLGNENQMPTEQPPIGGIYMHLEADWREKHRQNKMKANGK